MRLFKPLERSTEVEMRILAMETPEAAFVAGSVFGTVYNTTNDGRFSIEEALEIVDMDLARDRVPDLFGLSFLKGVQVALEDRGVRRV